MLVFSNSTYLQGTHTVIKIMIKKFILTSIYLLLAVALLFAQTESPKEEDKSGKKTFEMVQKEYGIYSNEPLLKEVEAVGRALEKEMPFNKPLRYFLIDTPEPNAFATLGGYVYVTRGLLSIVNTKDELAGVMAHELSHVIKHHPRKKIEVVIIPALLELPANIVAALVDPELGNLLNAPIAIPSNLGIAAFSRSQEREADLSGVDIATKAGFNPYGLVSALERLEVYVEYITHEPAKKTAMIDHPLTSDHVIYLTSYLQTKGFTRSPEVSGTTIATIDNLLYGQDPKYGIVQSNLYTHPVLQYQIQLPEDWLADVANDKVVSISKDKKHCISLSCDTTSKSIETLAQQARAKINSSYNVTTDTSSINGLKAIRLSVYIASKSKNCEMIWIQLPNKKCVVKAVGLYDAGLDNKDVLTCFHSTKAITKDYLVNIYYKTIALKKEVDNQKIADYAATSDTTEITVLSLLNNVRAEDIIKNEGKFVKTFNHIPLVLYKE